MAVTADIIRTWRGPRAVMRDLLARGRREDRALAYLIVFCLLVFVAQWPRLARTAAGFEPVPGGAPASIEQLMTYTLFAWLTIWPLAFYAIAALSHIIARAFRGRGTFYTARLALFWSLLASVPLLLLYGLMAGFLGQVAGTHLVGAAWVAAFVWIWLQSLREAEA